MQEKNETPIAIFDRNCIICDIDFKWWINSKYCPNCKVIVKKKQDLEANRRARKNKKEQDAR